MPAAYVNGYRAVDFKDFSGGLNLRDAAGTVGDKEAIDLLNVDFTERGAMRQRDGYQDLTQTDLNQRVDSLSPYYNVSGAKHLIAGCGTRLETLNALGAPIANRVGLSGGPWTFARFGDPLHEYVYCANGIDTLQRWDGTSWADGGALATVNGVTGVAMPRAGAIAVTASVAGSSSGTNASNRLIATAFGALTTGGPGGTPSNPSRVYFSNPGRPELWETDGLAITPIPTEGPLLRGRNYTDLTPGDGERIMAAVTWRELVFIFKETKFFVFWGEGQGADATPTFQVREVVNNVGLASPQAVCVGRDGVYFANRRGVYRTSGGDPQLVSDIISPMWTQDPDIYFQSSPINLARLDLIRALWSMERLYLAVPTGASNYCDRVLTYDTQHQWWSLYDLPASALASFRAGDASAIHFGYSTGPNRVGYRAPGAETDRNGQVITSRWRSGWSDYGGQQTTIRETKVWGSGAVSVAFSVDFNRTFRPGLDTPLGTRQRWPLDGAGTWNDWLALGDGLWPGAGQTSDALVRYATRGTVFSTQFSNSPSAPTWAVHRVARHLREIREPSIR